MMTEQLTKTNGLGRKISDNEEILKNLRKSNDVNNEQERPFILVRLLYYPEDGLMHEMLIDPEWFYSPELKADFQHCVKIAKEGFMELLEKDLQLMKKEMNTLKSQ